MRRLGREYILTPECGAQVDFNHIISFNGTAAFLWEAMQGRDFSTEDMAASLEQEYSISHETAMADSSNLISTWLGAGLLQQP